MYQMSSVLYLQLSILLCFDAAQASSVSDRDPKRMQQMIIASPQDNIHVLVVLKNAIKAYQIERVRELVKIGVNASKDPDILLAVVTCCSELTNQYRAAKKEEQRKALRLKLATLYDISSLVLTLHPDPSGIEKRCDMSHVSSRPCSICRPIYQYVYGPKGFVYNPLEVERPIHLQQEVRCKTTCISA